MYCKNCGAKINEVYGFCINCGTKVNDETDNNISEIKSNNKLGIILLLIIVGILALIIGSNIIVSNKAENMGKNKDYYEKTGAFNNGNNKDSLLRKYNIDNTEYLTLQSLAGKVESEIKKNNISNADLYYRKSQKDDLGEPYIVVRGNNKYITINVSDTTIEDGNKKNIVLNQTIAEYYDNIFTKAKNDTNYQNLIYFSSLNELLKSFN